MSLKIERIINTPIPSNCFVIYTDNKHDGCIIVDPGSEDCKELLSFLNKINTDPQYIILTHEHFDHIWGVALLRKLYNVEVICSKYCSEAIKNKKKNLSVFYNQIEFEIISANRTIEELKFILRWNKLVFEFINTKGHSEGSICISIENSLLQAIH